MYFFIAGTSFIIGTLFYKSIRDCLTNKFRRNDDYIFVERLERMPVFDYLQRNNILQFFSEDKNLYKLKKVLDFDNKIFEKTKNLIDSNPEMLEDYLDTQSCYGDKWFHMEPLNPIIIELRDCKFKTSIGQLNFFRWVILNDYFLHIE